MPAASCRACRWAAWAFGARCTTATSTSRYVLLAIDWSDLRADSQSWMHGVAPHMCDQVVRPLLDQGAGGRSPGFLLLAMALGGPAYSLQKSLSRFGPRSSDLAAWRWARRTPHNQQIASQT